MIKSTTNITVFLRCYNMTERACRHGYRDQTEEWKGWMQVMFVWYHVFAAKEWYNWIRVYIAAYVWMTGFGEYCHMTLPQSIMTYRYRFGYVDEALPAVMALLRIYKKKHDAITHFPVVYKNRCNRIHVLYFTLLF